MREDLKEMTKDFDKSEDDLKSLQSGVGQIVGEVLRQLTEDKCTFLLLLVCTCVFSLPGILSSSSTVSTFLSLAFFHHVIQSL